MNTLRDNVAEAGYKLEQRLIREIESGELARTKRLSQGP